MSARLWERQQQLSVAAARIAATREGRGGSVFFVGQAGLGKTTILDESCRRAPDDVVVVRARCDAMEASLPFGLVSQVVGALGGRDDVWRAATDQGDPRSATLYRTLRWLEEVGRGPVLIAIDDLQWSDPDSLVLLGFLCRRLARLPVAVIASLRPWPAVAADLAWGLARGGDAVVEHLLPLSKEAAAAVLVEAFGDRVSADAAEGAWRLSGGNPLLLGLAAGAAAAERATSPDADPLSASAVERSLMLRRFAGVTPDGIRWAEAAAVLGIEFWPEIVAEVAGLDGEAAHTAAEAVWRSGLIRAGRNGASEFIQPLFRQLLYDDVPPAVRATRHARAFTALTARGMDDIAAEHAMRANLAGDERAIRVLTETGRRALRAGAAASAASRLEAAVRLSGDASATALRADLGEALLEAGRGAEAASTINQMLETDIPIVQRVAALTMLSRAHFAMGDFDSARTALESAAALAEQECPEAVVLPLCRHADAVLMTAGPAAALPWAARARALAGGSKRLWAQASAKWGMLALYCGDPSGLTTAESAGRHLLGASQAEIAADIRYGGSGVLVPFACAAMYGEHFSDAEAAIRAGVAEAERVGAVTAAAALGVCYGLMLLRTRLHDTLAVADRLLAVADLVPLAEPFARTLKSYALLELGAEEQSEIERERARPAAAAYRIWVSLLWLDHGEAVGFLRHGWFKKASDAYVDLEERYGELGIGEPCVIPYARHAVVAHAAAGRTQDAERVVAWLDERAARLPCRWPASAAAAGKAQLALRAGDRDEADKWYRTALDHLSGTSLPLEHAELLIEYGTMLRREGQPREARESLRRAGELAESVGAVWLARRAGEELAAAGGRKRIRRGARELTAQEQRVARLAATGASDKDMAAHLTVSVSTVRTHLEHVYAKLGVHSRRELMSMGERLEALIARKG